MTALELESVDLCVVGVQNNSKADTIINKGGSFEYIWKKRWMFNGSSENAHKSVSEGRSLKVQKKT